MPSNKQGLLGLLVMIQIIGFNTISPIHCSDVRSGEFTSAQIRARGARAVPFRNVRGVKSVILGSQVS